MREISLTDEMSDDWIHAARLKKGRQTKKVKAELKRMADTELVRIKDVLEEEEQQT